MPSFQFKLGPLYLVDVAVLHDALNVLHIVATATLSLGMQKAGQKKRLSCVEALSVPDVRTVNQTGELSIITLLTHGVSIARGLEIV